LHEVIHGSAAESFAARKDAIESGDAQSFGFEIARYGVCKLIVSCC